MCMEAINFYGCVSLSLTAVSHTISVNFVFSGGGSSAVHCFSCEGESFNFLMI